MLRYLTVPVTAFQQNASLVWCDATHKAAVIDPGGDLDSLCRVGGAVRNDIGRNGSRVEISFAPQASGPLAGRA